VPGGASWLLLGDPASFAGRAASLLTSLGDRPIVAGPAKAFERVSATEYRLDPSDAAHYRLLFDAIGGEGRLPDRVLDCYSCDERPQDRSNQSAECLRVLSVYQAMRSAIDRQTLSDIRPTLTFVSSQSQRVLPDDPIDPDRAAIPALVLSMEQEWDRVVVKHVDLACASGDSAIDRLLQEACAPDVEREIGYRDGCRFVPRMTRADLGSAGGRRAPFERNGVYLVSGGLSPIGMQLSHFLVERYGSRLVLIGRRTPDGDDESGERGERARAMASLGDAAIYLQADVGDIDGLRNALSAAKRRFGAGLDGVIHLAGSYDERLLTEETPSTFEAALRAKVAGGWNLHRLLLDEPGSLFIGFSSLTSVLGSAMVGAYSAANRYLEGLSLFQTGAGMRGHALSWSGWEGIGISRRFGRTDVLEAKGVSMISSRRALASFHVAIGGEPGPTFIGLDSDRAAVQRRMTSPLSAARLVAYAPSVNGNLATIVLPAAEDRFGRPIAVDLKKGLPPHAPAAESAAAPAAPATDLERQIAGIWKDVLATDSVGREDNFFDLGGHSALVFQIHRRLVELTSRDFPVLDLFRYPTVAALAGYLDARIPTAPAARGDAESRADARRAGALRQRDLRARRRGDPPSE
jgi:hypothetical protein